MRDKIQVITLTIITIIGLIWACHYEHTYSMPATVYAVEGDTATFIDCTDCFWEYVGAEGLSVGDTVTVKFNDSFSMSNRCDDVIISFKRR